MGDLAILSRKNIKTHRPPKKFGVKMHGPFKVIRAVSPIVYKLKLPKN
jgi:hypothetical protein